MELFETKTFTMHSGDIGHWKIECDALTEKDIETLALMISERFNFYGVYGIPTGAVRIQEALEKYIDPDSDTFLIVDDVLTTGASMEEAKKELNESAKFGRPYQTLGVVLFARTKPADWIYPIFQLWSK
jgi:hypothetical protein